ncbi:MAG: chemotaxis protein CheW, partial [Deltaproteobacteria bacterium]|nr:chemotaxis protein CheW [Deltaproteobacteria bacterium]
DNSFLTFRVGQYCLAVPAVDAEAIITMPEIRSVPLTPDSVAGVFSHRGKITVVISLKRKFGMRESDDRSAGQLIISRISTGLTAFMVDEVLDIIPASGLNFSTLPALGMLTAFDRFAVKSDEIILRTDFELLCRLEDSEELADSLKSLTRALKPKSDPDKLVLNENIPISESNFQTSIEEKVEFDRIIHSTSHDSSHSAGKYSGIGTEKVSKQKFKTAGNRSARKAIPYKARTVKRPPPAGHRLPPNRLRTA